MDRTPWFALAAMIATSVMPFKVSAQDQIVMSGPGAWEANETWRLGPNPVLELGSSTVPEENFGDIRSVALLQDGSVLVADRMAGELKLFDETGTFLRTMGRPGEGPGEFKGLAGVQLLREDTIAVFDQPLRRWTAFSKSGKVLGSHTFSSQELPGVSRAYRHGNGRFTVAGAVVVGPGSGPGYFDLSIPLFSVDIENDQSVFLREVPGRQLYRTKNGALGQALVLRSGCLAIGDRIFVGDGRAWQITVLDQEGTLVEVWERTGVDLSVSDSRLRAAEERSLERFSGNQQALARWRRFYSEIPRPSSLPAYSSLLLDSEGFLWVKGYSLPGEPAASWSVFHPTGIYLGDVRVPDQFDLMTVTGQYALGVWRDDLEVQHVRVYLVEGRN